MVDNGVNIRAYADGGDYERIIKYFDDLAQDGNGNEIDRTNREARARALVKAVGVAIDTAHSKGYEEALTTLLGIAIDIRLPQRARECAGKQAVELSELKDIGQFVTNTLLPRVVQEEAGTKAVQLYTEGGFYEALIAFSTNPNIPRYVQDIAKGAIENAALRAVAAHIAESDYNTLLGIARNTNLSDSVREAAGIAGLDSEIFHANFMLVSTDTTLPVKVREAAIRKAIDTCDDQAALLDIARDKVMPLQIRETAGIKALSCAGRQFTVYKDLLTDKTLPASVRRTAGKMAINEAEYLGNSAIQEDKGGIWVGALLGITAGSNVPLRIKVRAGRAAVEMCKKTCDLETLRTIAENENLPHAVQTSASNAILNMTRRTATVNPLANDGKLSVGTVRPPGQARAEGAQAARLTR